MCDKMAYILKIVENDPFLRLQMRAKKMFNRQFFSTNKQYVKIKRIKMGQICGVFFGKDEILVKV